MKVRLIFKACHDDTPEARSVEVNIRDCPEEISVGDTFRLNLFKDMGCAKVTKRSWNEQKICVINCEVSTSIIVELAKQADNIPGAQHYFELPEQTWIGLKLQS